MNSAAVKTDGRYTLKIVNDEDAVNPREDYDNFGHMMCWHSRYNLGDKHEHSEPNDFLKELVRETVPDKDLIAYVKDGKADGLTLAYDRSAREWEPKAYDSYFKKWYVEWSSPPPLGGKDQYLADGIRDNLTDRDLMSLAEWQHLIMPLYLLDHSGITISTHDFHDRWDSGQVGWTYASHADVAKEYGDASPENIKKARKLLNSEVGTYDCYLRGECYGFQLFRDGVEEDSCWGFLGSFEDAKQSIRGYIPEEAAALIDDAQYGDDDPEYDPEEKIYDETENEI
jgi:hypothetical protein